MKLCSARFVIYERSKMAAVLRCWGKKSYRRKGLAGVFKEEEEVAVWEEERRVAGEVAGAYRTA